MAKRSFNQRLYDCLGKVVSLRRKRLGMTQDTLAMESGVDRAFISKIETGARNPSFGVVAQIAEALKMRYWRLVQNCEKCTKDLGDA